MQGGTAGPNRQFWNGHTGFTESWLSLWLHGLGAKVAGLSLPPPTEPGLFTLAGLSDPVPTVPADIRDPDAVRDAITEPRPETVFHPAPQSLARVSRHEPDRDAGRSDFHAGGCR
jgi:CDP-glucose 4,6-dehydratase